MEKERHFLCIDLKSFFASCECIERNLDSFTTPLVVANKNQGNGAITLAVSPYLKNKGIKGRTRLYEIPKNIKYFIVNPRMKLYMKKSKDVVSIYLDFVSYEDLHIYSIDECFLDLTNYLTLYKKSDYEIAQDILNTIKKKTGLTATCGIGPNMLLAKVAMDIDAKHQKNCIAKWTEKEITEISHEVEKENENIGYWMSEMEKSNIPNWLGNSALEWGRTHDLRTESLNRFFTESVFAVEKEEPEKDRNAYTRE